MRLESLASRVYVEVAAGILEDLFSGVIEDTTEFLQTRQQLEEVCRNIVFAAVEEVAARLAEMEPPPLPRAAVVQQAMVSALRGED